jgi:hypothetical protein
MVAIAEEIHRLAKDGLGSGKAGRNTEIRQWVRLKVVVERRPFARRLR